MFCPIILPSAESLSKLSRISTNLLGLHIRLIWPFGNLKNRKAKIYCLIIAFDD